ncbi:hypothetical protein IEU95_11520 [Hoyosella rhizosphaerae]|uniref:Uncharacterized protein n=1 Tax=Hoyosella rhizosphaerae TaxID=1755582 RepID=A0A916U9M6_9ACTN|nr:hypothetical protein [Hoyosella rhizosphaerae]MBN4927463.1 hypothetical protein [Hoyosella rhizosphaerae]GGC64228.1 hypothetical protein GCM10011410_15910 [Hoyosella rhizosphaerae]
MAAEGSHRNRVLFQSIAGVAVIAGIASGVRMFMRRGEAVDEPAPRPPRLADYDGSF